MQGNTAGGRVRPEGKFELFTWVFMRISGVLLCFLAIGHLFIMHVINSIDTIDYDFVVERFATPFWRTYDLLMLFLAMMHGTNGIRVLIGDYIRKPGKRLFALSALYTISFAVVLLGAMILFTFSTN